jgi:hypothetical protein
MVAIRQGRQHGCQSIFDKVCMLDRRTGFVEDLPLPQENVMQMRTKTLEIRLRQRAQCLISDCGAG